MKKIAAIATVVTVAFGSAGVFAESTMDGMKGMPMDKMAADAKGIVHKAKGTIKKVDAKAGVVTLAHGPVPSLNWPAMTMGFKVSDQALLGKLGEGQSVEFEFVQTGKDYTVTAVK